MRSKRTLVRFSTAASPSHTGTACRPDDLQILFGTSYERNRRHRRRIAQRTERPTQHVFRQVLNVVDVFLHAAAGMKTHQRLLQPVRALAAGNAPSAALVLVELHRPQRELHDALLVRRSPPRRPNPASIRPSPPNRNPWRHRSRPAVSTGHDDPPGTTAFNLRPFGMPPPTS